MRHAVHMVENPEHLTLYQIKDKFWDNYVLVTNAVEGSHSGIVRYYCYSNEPELTQLIMEMEKDMETYGDCLLYYVGPGRGFMGVYL